ncbi:PREDICTED: uncharacterized protein LOC109154744 [Ipomoea nil]|uniref:uncharacterized protein LOC109154744 n=1 Tax=Ipomoea nil TaxID=35883 RepID=UPI0009009993|nr:PREDICTED: uncharacterized protein LOC109154744 [Ipomoea nil]
MVKKRNQRKGKIPRRGTTPQYAVSGVPSNPVCIEEEDLTTIIMDQVPISQVPFEEVQEHQNPNPGNLTDELHGDFTICLPTINETGDNTNCTQVEEEHPMVGVVEPSSPPPLSDREQRKRRKSDPYEGADPRAKRPNDFPISARPPRITPNIPPPKQNNPKKQKEKITEEEQDWVPEDLSEASVCDKAHPEKKKKKLGIKEKGKQKVVSDADLSKLPKPYSPKFLSKENSKTWKKILGEKGSVINIDPYEEQAVKEFYCNLTKDSSSPSNPMYGKAYLRGKFYEFNPEIINNHLGTTSEEQGVQIESEQVIQELTTGNVSFDKNKIKAASLTSKYAILQKIALVNWMPSLHETTVKWSLAELLYKIGKGIKVNIGDIMYSQITNLTESSESKASLSFPNLIYSILSKQGLKSHGPKTQVKTINTTMKLKKGGHQNDLKASIPTEDPTDQKTLLKYFEKRLNELENSEKQILRKHMEIKEEKAEVLQWLQALKPDNREEEDKTEETQKNDQEGSDKHDDSSEEESQKNNQEEDVETTVSTSPV